MAKVSELMKEIQETHKQVSSSQKDETRIMQAMLNDTSYEVGVYGKQGKIDVYNPAKEFKQMQSNIVSAVTKISKEFFNTYLNTGRKLCLGGREKSNYSLAAKDIPKTEKTYQRGVVGSDGAITWQPMRKTIPAHKGLKARSSCPAWVK